MQCNPTQLLPSTAKCFQALLFLVIDSLMQSLCPLLLTDLSGSHNNGVFTYHHIKQRVDCIDFFCCCYFFDSIVSGLDPICTSNHIPYKVLAGWCLRLVLFVTGPFLRIEEAMSESRSKGFSDISIEKVSWRSSPLRSLLPFSQPTFAGTRPLS